MKRVILMVASVCIMLTAKAQVSIKGCTVTMIGNPGMLAKNDTLSVEFKPGEYAWGITITNNLSTDLSVFWDKSSFIVNGSVSKIIFANTLKLNINNVIPADELPSGTHLDKNIFPAGYFTERYATPTISKKKLKEVGKSIPVSIVIALDVNGAIKKHTYSFNITPQ